MLGLVVIFLLLYLIIPPGSFWAIKTLKNYLKSQLFGRRRSATALRAEASVEGFNQKLSKRIKFTLKDPRNKPIPFRLLFITIYLAGLIVSVLAVFLGGWKILVFSFILAYVSFLFSYFSANKIIKERDQVLKRMLELKQGKMRLVNRDKGVVPKPSSEFKVLDWHEDLVTPTRLHLFMPTDFDTLEVDGFLESFNRVFNSKGQWISDDTDEQHGGFDFNAGVAAIRVTTPLPQMATWHERYLDSKDIHWSYFPLALGSENGVPVYNEELEQTEHVLGFAVNGGQEKLSKKNEVVIGSEITSAPQILIAGGTGGGKSLDSKTEIEVILKE